MDRLWAPWRRPYILSDHDEPQGCIFCDLPAAGSEHYRDNLILSCGERAFLILNRYPYNNGHVMVVPRAHVADPTALSTSDYRALTELLRRATEALRRTHDPDGINVGMNLGRTAGAGIADHCHYHLVPRWNGDTNFMPVTAEAKIIVQSLEEMYRVLQEHRTT